MTAIETIRPALRDLAGEAKAYFAAARAHATDENETGYLADIFSGIPHSQIDYFWSQLPIATQETAETLVDRLLPQCAALAEHTKSSALTDSADTHAIRIATKEMSAALRLRKYTYRRSDVIHDEDKILGFQPAEQFESLCLSPEKSEIEFFDRLKTLNSVLKIVEASPHADISSLIGSIPATTKYRAGTAFIMMWMDPAHPELMDIADAVRAVFRNFGISAIRADDIEHGGLISEKVTNEIRTAEFLFADLTGIRPNVYYEIGFAHALGKNVILLRKTGTGIHFDLVGYNCPEYVNIGDLKNKLTKRLINITNRNPKDIEVI
jgi:hypothetical protein